MLRSIKERGLKIGLISNCFSEESELIKKSVLYPFFDAPFLSYEQGICKPDEEIFIRCVDKLGVKPEECLYIGDGGSHELEVSLRIGMHAAQACWYLKEGTKQPCGRLDGYIHLENPMEVLELVSGILPGLE